MVSYSLAKMKIATATTSSQWRFQLYFMVAHIGRIPNFSSRRKSLYRAYKSFSFHNQTTIYEFVKLRDIHQSKNIDPELK